VAFDPRQTLLIYIIYLCIYNNVCNTYIWPKQKRAAGAQKAAAMMHAHTHIYTRQRWRINMDTCVHLLYGNSGGVLCKKYMCCVDARREKLRFRYVLWSKYNDSGVHTSKSIINYARFELWER
jgi:hypothetical protein